MFQAEKVLLLYAHPESQESVANRVLLAPAFQLKNVTVHDLYAHYPDFFIDVSYERKLLHQHKVLVFQHPLYTYSCPALLKEWLDRVLGRSFSNSAKGKQTEGKYWRSVITAGEPENVYSHKEENHFFISEILRPFELTASMCRMNWITPLIIYLAKKKTLQELEEHARSYRDWLASPIPKGN